MQTRVLHLISTFGPGGAERQLSLLAPALVAAGVECNVAYLNEGPNLRRLADSGVNLYRLPQRRSNDPRIIIDLLALMRRLRPHLVQTWLLQMDVFGGVAAKLLKMPTVLSERSSRGAYPNHWKNNIRLVVGMNADGIVANSKGGLEYWQENGRLENLWLIRNALPSMQETSSTSTVTRERGLVLFAGRLCEEKNILVLADALIQLVTERPGLTVKMFGEGPLRKELEERLIRSRVHESIELAGYTEDLALWMKRASICVSVSKFEGNPNVVIEAANLGCPLVLSDIPAHKEILNDESAWFVQNNESDEIVKAIITALDNRELTLLKAQAAKSSVSAFNLECITQQYVSTYEHILQIR